jgi:hypothetical protein
MSACGEALSQESVSLMELTYMFRVLGDVLKDPIAISRLLAPLLSEWWSSSLIFEQLHVVHLQIFPTIPNDSLMGFYATDEESVIAVCLKAKRPSRFLSGLRQFKSAIVPIRDPRGFRFMKSLGPETASPVRVLTTLVLQPGCIRRYTMGSRRPRLDPVASARGRMGRESGARRCSRSPAGS